MKEGGLLWDMGRQETFQSEHTLKHQALAQKTQGNRASDELYQSYNGSEKTVKC